MCFLLAAVWTLVVLGINLNAPEEFVEIGLVNTTMWEINQVICGLSLFMAALCATLENYIEG